MCAIETENEYQSKRLEAYNLMDALCNPANAGKISEIEKRLSELEDVITAWEKEHYPMYYEEK